MEDNVLDDLVGNFDEPKRPLPNAQASFILGILSIFPGCFCSCLGIIVGVIGLVMASNAIKEYNANPAAYLESDFKQASNGKTLSIVGLVLTVISMVLGLILNIGTAVMESGF